MVDRATTSAVDVYKQQTLKLVRSLVIKSELSADRINKAIMARHGNDSVDEDRPWTWKYYLNLAGQYHFTDTMMKVISLDTQQEIDFTVENMKIHTATAEAYKYGTRYYFSLTNTYPNQVQLILAVNNPVEIHKAIAGEDGDILSYYRDLVEPQEYTLIHDLQIYIKNYLMRYQVEGFNNIWKNYPTLNYAGMFQSLAAQIMNLRLEAIKTDRTHSFHITQYLASHNYLDKFIPYMTLKQKLYLYHNIDYLEKHAGFTNVFEELIQWILTDRNIPLSSYTVRQLKEFNGELYPDLRAHRKYLGTRANTVEAEYVDIEELYNKEKPIQPGNAEYYRDNELAITHALATDNTSVIQTKDLESAMIDYSDAVPDSLPDVLLRQWAYMSANGLYKVLTNFTHPVTGDRISLMAEEALIYYSYVFLASFKSAPKYVPDFVDIKFRLHPRPPVTLLYRDLVPEKYPDLKQYADALVSSQPDIVECLSVTAFFDLSYKVYEECQKHWFTLANIHDPMKRGIVAKMVSRLFGIGCFQLAPNGTLMDEWLTERSLPKFEGTYQDGMNLCATIFQASTGYAIDETKTLRSVQKAMIEMFKQLSSYSIQVMREINDSAIIPLNWPAVRVGFEGQDVTEDYHIESGVRVVVADTELEADIHVPIANVLVKADTDYSDMNYHVEAGVRVKLCGGEHNTVISHSIEIAPIRVYEPTTRVFDASTNYFGREYYDNLTPAQRLVLANRPNYGAQ